MFEIYAKLVGWTVNLLAWLSAKQVQAAHLRVRSCTKLIEENNKALLAYQKRAEDRRIALENERDEMQNFIDMIATEL